jgi:hypothetical protein
MQKVTFTKQMIAAAFISIFPIAASAQELKNEVHIKIVENGVVTKDTSYAFTGEVPEVGYFNGKPEHHQGGKPGHMMEKHVIIINDSTDQDFEWKQAGGDNENQDIREEKEVKVIVHSGMGKERSGDVQEIWIGGEEGKPCRTIIIHEGECQGGNMEKEVKVIVTDDDDFVWEDASSEQKHGDKPENVTRKVVKTDGGKKVMIIETIDDSKKDKKKK